MPGATPLYLLPHATLDDPPHGPDATENLAVAVESQLQRIDQYAGGLIQPYRASQSVAATAASITFSGIPSTLKDLELRWSLRANDPGFMAQTLWMRINGNSASSQYRTLNVQTAAGAVTSANFVGAGVPGGAAAHLGLSATNGAPAGVYAGGSVRFSAWNAPHTNNLVWSYDAFLAANDTSGNIWQTNGSGVYIGAGPYTSITLFPVLGSFVAGSQATLLGWY